ncbi:MAG: lipoate--protein ligase family protein [Pirellulales bacterium]|nr:lipoate--protein ligase family protein [Pirellulales bacterium]
MDAQFLNQIPCCLLLDPPGDGAWNMAVDESLLESLAEGRTCCWRFYQWREPTLSLGYFQDLDDRRRHPPSAECPIVRRASGGGAIVHDIELTYSLIVPAAQPLARQAPRLYATVHQTLIEALAQLGVNGASLYGHDGGDAGGQLPFLCFERRSPGDVVYGGAKIAGSAQRRRRGAVLQHGSILLGRSAAAPELPGIAQLAGRTVTGDELTDVWLPLLKKRLGLTFSNHALTESQHRLAQRYVDDKYASHHWTRGRHAPLG